MQGLQIQLPRRFHRPHGGPLHGFGYRFGISIIVLVALKEGFYVFGRHHPGVMAKRDQPASDG